MVISGVNNIGNQYLMEQKNKAKTTNFENMLKEAENSNDDMKLKEACKEFEAYFIQQLFKEMKSTVNEGGLIPKSQGEEVFEEMLHEQYSKEASKGQGIGIAQMMYKQLGASTMSVSDKINNN